MEYYTLGKRNVHWANSVWHVAARAHCITSPPPPCTLPSLHNWWKHFANTQLLLLTGVSAAPNMDIYLFPHLNEA